jgi:hypothetical protein
MKLTKTQRLLLKLAAENPHGVTSVQSGFITSRCATAHAPGRQRSSFATSACSSTSPRFLTASTNGFCS